MWQLQRKEEGRKENERRQRTKRRREGRRKKSGEESGKRVKEKGNDRAQQIGFNHHILLYFYT